jgi:hypothetical protein
VDTGGEPSRLPGNFLWLLFYCNIFFAFLPPSGGVPERNHKHIFLVQIWSSTHHALTYKPLWSDVWTLGGGQCHISERCKVQLIPSGWCCLGEEEEEEDEETETELTAH